MNPSNSQPPSEGMESAEDFSDELGDEALDRKDRTSASRCCASATGPAYKA